MKTITINDKEYYLRHQPRGYGYQIMEKTPLPSENNGLLRRAKYACLFHTGDKVLAQTLFKEMEDTNELPKFPEPQPVVCPEKILVHRTKHYEGYYSVPTMETLEATFRHILKNEYELSIENMKPSDIIKNDSGVESEEEIESIPIEKVRERVREKWNEYKKELNEYAKYAKEWMNLKAVIEGGGHVWSAMEAFEADQYEIEDLKLIKVE